MKTIFAAALLSTVLLAPFASASGSLGNTLYKVEDTVNDATGSGDACSAGVIPLAFCVANDAYEFASDTAADAQREALRDVGIVVAAVKDPACDILYGSPNSPACPLNRALPSPEPVVL